MARPLGPSIEIDGSIRTMRELTQALNDAGISFRKYAERALKRSLGTGKTAASKVVREDIALPKKKVDRSINTRILSERALTGRLAVKDFPWELIEFMSQKQIISAIRAGRTRKSRGVSVKVYKKKGKTLYPDTFVAVMPKTFHVGVYKRVSKSRLPIKKQYGPSSASVFERVLPVFAARASEVLLKNIEQQLKFAVSKL